MFMHQGQTDKTMFMHQGQTDDIISLSLMHEHCLTIIHQFVLDA